MSYKTEECDSLKVGRPYCDSLSCPGDTTSQLTVQAFLIRIPTVPFTGSGILHMLKPSGKFACFVRHIKAHRIWWTDVCLRVSQARSMHRHIPTLSRTFFPDLDVKPYRHRQKHIIAVGGGSSWCVLLGRGRSGPVCSGWGTSKTLGAGDQMSHTQSPLLPPSAPQWAQQRPVSSY